MKATDKFLEALAQLPGKGWKVKRCGLLIRLRSPKCLVKDFPHSLLTALATDLGAKGIEHFGQDDAAILFLRSNGFPGLRKTRIVRGTETACWNWDYPQRVIRTRILKIFRLQPDTFPRV